MLLTIPHDIAYETGASVPLSDIARSLISVESASRYLPGIIEEIFPGVKVEALDVRLKSAASGSLFENFLLHLAISSQDHLENYLARLGTSHGITTLERHPKIVSRILTGIILAGAGYAIGLTTDNPEYGTRVNIQQQYIFVTTGEIANVSPESIRDAIGNATKNTRDRVHLAKKSVDFFAPAKSGGSTSAVKAGGDIIINPETIADIPSAPQMETVEDEVTQKRFANISIDIRVIDRDQLDHGWKAVIPEISERRVRLIASPSIDLADLTRRAANGKIVGDISVEYIGFKGIEKPIAYHLYNIRE